MRKLYYLLGFMWLADMAMIIYGWEPFVKAFAITICTNFAFLFFDQGRRR